MKWGKEKQTVVGATLYENKVQSSSHNRKAEVTNISNEAAHASKNLYSETAPKLKSEMGQTACVKRSLRPRGKPNVFLLQISCLLPVAPGQIRSKGRTLTKKKTSVRNGTIRHRLSKFVLSHGEKKPKGEKHVGRAHKN